MSDDIGPQGLLDHVESVTLDGGRDYTSWEKRTDEGELARELRLARDYLASDAGKANLALDRALRDSLVVETYPYRVVELPKPNRYRIRRSDGSAVHGIWEADPLLDRYTCVDTEGASIPRFIFGYEMQHFGLTVVPVSSSSTGGTYRLSPGAFDPPPVAQSASVTARGGVGAAEVPQMEAPASEPAKPVYAADDFVTIMRRMREIRAAEGRSAPV